MEYWKGYYKKNGTRILVLIYDKPKPDLFDSYTIGEVTFLADGHTEDIPEDADIDILYSIERRISSEEFSALYDLTKLSTELFLNQYAGGFPREVACNWYLQDIGNKLPKTLEIQLKQ